MKTKLEKHTIARKKNILIIEVCIDNEVKYFLKSMKKLTKKTLKDLDFIKEYVTLPEDSSLLSDFINILCFELDARTIEIRHSLYLFDELISIFSGQLERASFTIYGTHTNLEPFEEFSKESISLFSSSSSAVIFQKNKKFYSCPAIISLRLAYELISKESFVLDFSEFPRGFRLNQTLFKYSSDLDIFLEDLPKDFLDNSV